MTKKKSSRTVKMVDPDPGYEPPAPYISGATTDKNVKATSDYDWDMFRRPGDTWAQDRDKVQYMFLTKES